MKVVTSQQMRELDRLAIEKWGIPSLTLMENAGIAVAETAARLTESERQRVILVVCGSGNNGGDGLVAARHLNAWRRSVEVFLAAPRDKLTEDAAINLKKLEESGVIVTQAKQADPIAAACRKASLVIDALLGTGITGKVGGLAEQIIEAINDSCKSVLAVDIPSGLEADTGKPLGVVIRALETVTMGLPKIGLYLYPGMDFAGKLTVADIGFPPDLIEQSPSVADLTESQRVRMLLPARRFSAHKGTFGQVLVIAGSAGMTGAAALCAQGALRVGAGIVRVGCPASVNDIIEMKLTEAITYPLPETYNRTLDTRALALILELAEKVNAVAIGPGLSHEPETIVLVRRLVSRVEKPIVVDADGLNALANIAMILEGEHAPAILTPHPGEMGRLMGVTTEKIQARRVHFAEMAANRFNSTVVLKGARSIIAERGRPLTINPTGNPGMASGGTGDVLTGMIAGLLAQGLLPFEAAVAGVYLHGLAGNIAASKVGEPSLIASDIVDALPEAMKGLAGGGRENRF